jgi:hypothetical protein
MSEEVNVQVKFREETEKGEFSDALYTPFDDYVAMTKKEQDAWKAAKKKERIDKWKKYIDEESKKAGTEE